MNLRVGMRVRNVTDGAAGTVTAIHRDGLIHVREAKLSYPIQWHASHWMPQDRCPCGRRTPPGALICAECD